MNLDGYKSIFKKITPENAQTCYTEILTEIEKDLGERDAAVARDGENVKKIRELQDTNHKLFLSQMGGSSGGGSDDEDEHENPNDPYWLEKDFSEFLKEDK